MSFRKRNVGISRTPSAPTSTEPQTPAPLSTATPTYPGVRPSPIDGRPTTSTGILSLDSLLAGHAGLALGSSLLIEENGTTDFAGTVLRLVAAEGLTQEQKVIVVGVGEAWGRELPGLVSAADESGSGRKSTERKEEDKEKMKIAWRYERLGEFGAEKSRGPIPHDRLRSPASPGAPGQEHTAFTHTFDLAKRLTLSSSNPITYIPVSPSAANPFPPILAAIHKQVLSHLTSVHRILIPTLFSPFLYPPSAAQPTHILPFIHALRALLRRYPNTILITTLSLSLHPRRTGLTRSIETLSDGVLELSPFPSHTHAETLASSGAATKEEDKPQGMLKVHRLPVFHERGGGSAGLEEDLAFTLSRRKFLIKPFSLPPVEGDTEAQQGTGADIKAKDIEF